MFTYFKVRRVINYQIEIGVIDMARRAIEEPEEVTTLKQYYAKYLTDIRGLKQSTAVHYLDALRTLSRLLKSRGLVKRDIYEVGSFGQLQNLRDILSKDQEYIGLNERGDSMYRAALNHFLRFTQGDFINKMNLPVEKVDMPLAPPAQIDIDVPSLIEPPESYETTTKHWRRSPIIRDQALEFANFHCELHPDHQTFIAESTHHPYMEGHHLIPMAKQGEFDHSLDVYANIICLCPICHRRIHLGLKSDRIDMLKEIYDRRGERLQHSGLILTENEFVELGMRKS